MKPQQAKELLKACIANRINVLLVGDKGTGKTSLIEQATAEVTHILDYQCPDGATYVPTFPATADPTDVKGMPAIVDGHAEFLPFGDLRLLIEAQTPIVCSLEDLGQACTAVQATWMQPLWSRRVGGTLHIADCVSFVATSNRREDKAGVQSILEPLKNRFATIIELETDEAQWSQWAVENGIDVMVIAFLRRRPALLYEHAPTTAMSQSPCPRGWENVSDLLALNLPREITAEAVRGAVGEGAGNEFLAFLKLADEMPDPTDCLMNPDTAPVPTKPDVLYATATALAHRANKGNADRLFRYLDRLPPEFQVLCVRDTIRRKPEVQTTGGYTRWTVANQDVLL